jgi:hypothetical protein
MSLLELSKTGVNGASATAKELKAIRVRVENRKRLSTLRVRLGSEDEVKHVLAIVEKFNGSKAMALMTAFDLLDQSIEK